MPRGVYLHKRKDWNCPHIERGYFARCMCKVCYDAWYRIENMEQLSDYQRKRYGLTKTQLGKYHSAESKARQFQDKLKALALHNPDGEVRCSWPGCTVEDSDMLSLDHINDDGRSRRNAGEARGNGLYRIAARKRIPNLQTLCANHNLKKEIIRRRTGRMAAIEDA